MESTGCSRRNFVITVGWLAGAAALWSPVALAAGAITHPVPEDVTPTEDLMREHGVLRRLMLIYDEIAVRLKRGAEFPLAALTGTIDIIRRFIEDYHEKDEEDYLFTRFDKAGKMVELVKVLYAQHQTGRKVTNRLRELSTAGRVKQPDQRQQLAGLIETFNRMYRPHAAREDTVLYPAFRSVISPTDFKALGDIFEAKEQKLFGKDGFEKIVSEVAGLEKQLGLYELGRFTPGV